MKTDILPVNAASIKRAAFLLRAGEVVAFPTETVYGLGADALRPGAVLKIFAAKGRPADNPLIVHIAETDTLDMLTAHVDNRARQLMDRFWPGPLTLVLPKAGVVPDTVTAGLSTVAIRMPSHPAALALIKESGMPIAAPSANRSGRTSPTAAAHVLGDMQGRIPLILDGGPCGVGVESTVLDMTGERPVLLRPGGVTVEMISDVLPGLVVDRAVLHPLEEGATARSPGMKHKHYAPDAQVLVVRGEASRVIEKTRALYDAAQAQGKRVAILCPQNRTEAYALRNMHVLGTHTQDMAANLFEALWALDGEGVELIIAEATDTRDMGLALMNRLLRAADFSVIDV